MNNLPPRIKIALERIRERSSHYVDVKIIRGRCYVYESTSVWDKKAKQIKKLTKYLGRITEQGEFIPSNPRNPALSAAMIMSHDGASSIRKGVKEHLEKEKYGPKQEIGKYDVGILRALSEDGRITLPQLGRSIGLSASGAEWQRDSVEKRYGIKYLAEVDLDKLGFLTYIILIKFTDKIPPIKEIKSEFEQEQSVQLALLTQGEYDLIFYVVVSKYENMMMSFYNIRSRIFSNYDLKLYVAPFYQTYSFVPLRESFFNMLFERVWTRNKSQPRPRGDSLLKREYAVIKELCADGRSDFTQIDSKYKLTSGSARYTYHKLVESGIIKRTTISMQNVMLKYISVIVLQKINHVKYMRDREKVISHIIEDSEGSIINRYALEGDIKLPEGVFFIMPILNDGDMESANDSLKKISGTNMVNLIVTNVLVGNLCYRKLDRKHTIQYTILKEEYGLKEITPPEEVDNTTY